jgi:uncharacterized membrane protein YeiH
MYASIKSGEVHLVMTRVGMREATASVLAAGLIVLLRMLALWAGTSLPKPHWLQTGNCRVTKTESGTSTKRPE